MNDRLIDHTDVLLLQPVRAERGVALLPALDAVRDADGAHGIAVAQVFPVQANRVDRFVEQANSVFAGYQELGVRDAAFLRTLDAANNFPQLLFRTDGPYVVWLGIMKDTGTLETKFMPAAAQAARALAASGLLRGEPELVVLDPTRRSRLRWLEQGGREAGSGWAQTQPGNL